MLTFLAIMTRLLQQCSCTCTPWDVILTAGHYLTGIIHTILKNSKKLVSKLQLIPPVIPSWRPYMASDFTGELF